MPWMPIWQGQESLQNPSILGCLTTISEVMFRQPEATPLGHLNLSQYLRGFCQIKPLLWSKHSQFEIFKYTSFRIDIHCNFLFLFKKACHSKFLKLNQFLFLLKKPFKGNSIDCGKFISKKIDPLKGNYPSLIQKSINSGLIICALHQ